VPAEAAHPPFRCGECGARVSQDGDRLICERGHEAGHVTGSVLDFRRLRVGVDAELAAFWATSPEYYEIAGALNASYDEGSAHQRLIDTLSEAGAASVVDVGAGTGELGAALVARLPGLSYVGVDVSPVAVEGAQRLGRPGTFIAADAERLPFADGSFDAAVSVYALEHFIDAQAVLEEMARVVRPGGLVALLSISYDRAWGTIPSVRLGRAKRSRAFGRWEPLNLVVYAANRFRFGARQLGKHIRYAVDPEYLSFETVARPIVLEGRYDSDLDAVHVVSGRSTLRVLRRCGFTIVRSTVRDRPVAGFAVPQSVEIVARKGAGSAHDGAQTSERETLDRREIVPPKQQPDHD
jgi:SAM-dependent methyltransferase